MLTGNTGGVYYPLGIALGKIWERTLPGTRVSVQSTQASVENFNLLQQRRGSFAFGQGDVMSDAVQGQCRSRLPELSRPAAHGRRAVSRTTCTWSWR